MYCTFALYDFFLRVASPVSGILVYIALSKHRGLKLDGAIGQGEICNSLKS